MNFKKAIFHTILFIFLLEIIGLWILFIPDEIKFIGLIKAFHLFDSVITLILIVFISKSVKQFDILKFNKTEPKYYLIAIACGIGFVFFQSILNLAYYQEIQFNYELTFDRLTSLSVIASIIFIPITEELFFRNYILSGLMKNYNPTKAIILSSLLFASIHIPLVSLFYEFMDFSFNHAYITMFGGLISGILFYKTKSIIPSIIFHTFWNFTSYII